MIKKLQHELSKRERQIMEVVYRRKNVSVNEVLGEIPNPPSYSAVRAMMNILERKGLLKHRKEGLKYVYSPVVAHKKAMFAAVKQLINTYFNDSLEDAVAALLELHRNSITDDDLKKLTSLIDRAKKGIPK